MLDHQNLLAVQAAAQQAAHHALGSDATIVKVERWGGGAHNTGFKLLLADGRQLFMKVEKEDIFPRTRRCQIEREVYGIRLAAQAGLNVPEIISYDFNGQTAGCRYLLETFIDHDLLGEVLEKLPKDQHGPLLEEFQRKAEQIYAIRGDAFGELYLDGWLGRYASWRDMMGAYSTILIEDAQILGMYSSPEMAAICDAHAFALNAIRYEGPAILTHNDLHIWNAFIEPPLRVGKLFDFGLSLFQAEYVSCFGQFGFDGKEVEVARRFCVNESELRGYSLINGLEIVNFLNAIRFAPDQSYGCSARQKQYFDSCQEFLAAQ